MYLVLSLFCSKRLARMYIFTVLMFFPSFFLHESNICINRHHINYVKIWVLSAATLISRMTNYMNNQSNVPSQIGRWQDGAREKSGAFSKEPQTHSTSVSIAGTNQNSNTVLPKQKSCTPLTYPIISHLFQSRPRNLL